MDTGTGIALPIPMKTITKTGRDLKMLRKTCLHRSTIELADGTHVCTCCELVMPGAAK